MTRSHYLNSRKIACLSGCAMLAMVSGTAWAQSADESNGDEIIVTARLRAESLQDVPVVITALDKKTLDAFAVRDTQALATLTPSLVIEANPGSSGAGAITLRGVTTTTLSAASEQAVTTVIDGITLSNGLALKGGLIDLDQVEVLKGPQALYFGKNASGGVISLRSADPTKELFTQARYAREFNARENIAEVIVSGPLSETLGARLVGNFNNMDGYLNNKASGPVADRTKPDFRDLFGRATLLWRPSSDFDARFKISYADHKGHGPSANQFWVCRPGAPSNPADDCTLNDTIVKRDFPGKPPFDKFTLFITSLEMNYKPTEAVKLTSVTGYSKITQSFSDTALSTDTSLLINAEPRTNIYTLSQELRVATDMTGPFNAMVGVFFDKGRVAEDDRVLLGFGNNVIGAAAPELSQAVESKSFSVFGQASYKFLEQFELSGGLRYIRDTKDYTGRTLNTFTAGPVTFPIAPLQIVPNHKVYTATTPEVTLSWKPSSDLTLFGAYKEGFKSGSIQIAAAANFEATLAPKDISYLPEHVKGFEAGIKARLFDRSLTLNLAAYNYKYTDLQFSTFDPATLSTLIKNVGASRIKGIEGDFTFRPAGIEGLTLRGAVNYNHARFIDFLQDCNATQIASKTCPFPRGLTGGSQQLAGAQLIKAPDWSGSLGFGYDRELTSGLSFRLNGNITFSGKYNSDDRLDPRAVQKAYRLYDLSAGIRATDGGWELDLIGRNLGNTYYSDRGVAPVPGTNSAPTATTLGNPGDVMTTIGRPRTILLQLTVRPSVLFGR
jgi:iron complex outermembrane receptor protein